MRNMDLFQDYENAKLLDVAAYREKHSGSTYRYADLGKQEIDGIPLCVTKNAAGELEVTFTPDTHLLAIGATRSGKTTGYIIPTLHVLLSKKNKPGMVISDPKDELYRQYAGKFAAAGYRVLHLDFIDTRHSDCWNPLTQIYRLYQEYLHVEDSVQLVQTENGPRNAICGTVYESQTALDNELRERRNMLFDRVETLITGLAGIVLPTRNTHDPFWEDSARDLLCALLFGLLEDSESGHVTEDNFSFGTVLAAFDDFCGKNGENGSFFERRDRETSKAYRLASRCVLQQATNTRFCIQSCFAANMNRFRDSAVRRILCTNTFAIQDLDGDRPTVIFLTYKDEEGLYYRVISMFLHNLYTGLIAISRKKAEKRLSRPFYFLLDEFGNLPPFPDFDKVISACGGRNIWFLLVLQSYAQLCAVYGKDTAEIIKDNLNTHIFFGTNNPATKREFSEECGKKTVISPISALNGEGERIGRYVMDTVALVPVSALTAFEPGECIVTQIGSDVLRSKIVRSYTHAAFAPTPVRAPVSNGVRFSDPKYSYMPDEGKKKKKKLSEELFN